MILRRMGLGDGPTDHFDEDHDCFGKFSNTFISEGSPIFLPNFGSVFSRTTSFVLKMVFSHTWIRQV